MANDIGRLSKRVVQLFYDPPPRNDDNTGAAVWCLGKRYENPPHLMPNGQSPPNAAQSSPSTASASHSSDASYVDLQSQNTLPTENGDQQPHPDDDGGWPTAFLDDFESRLWMTYRSNFPLIQKSQNPRAASSMSLSVRIRSQFSKDDGFTSDTGWGCMIRSGQSLLANAVATLRLGRDWRRGAKGNDERDVVAMFADDPRAPFSIHKFVEHGATACGKHPGEWFGPSATARCIQALATDHQAAGLRVYITGDGSDVYEDRLMKVAKSSSGTFEPTLVLVGTRLGIDRVTPVYWEVLKASLQLPQSIGIAGGRPSASHYFIGNQGSYFFYLDPHITRPALPLHDDPTKYTEEDLALIHTRRLRRLHITEMDPSMLIGFLIRDEADWDAWKKGVAETAGKPIIHIATDEPTFASAGEEREGAIDEVQAFDDDEDGGLA